MDSRLEDLDALLLEGEKLLSTNEHEMHSFDIFHDVAHNVTVDKRIPRGIVKCRNYRLNRKAQRDQLRLEEKELRQQVSYLQQLRKEEKFRQDAKRSMSYLLSRGLADRLQVERKDAEIRQKQLRFVVDNQAMYIEAMREILANRVNSLMAFFDSELAVPFNWYIQELEARRLQMDDVFGVFHGTTTALKLQGVDTSADAFYPRAKVVLPSTVSETSNMFWQLGQQLFSTRQDFVKYQDPNYPDNTIITSFVDTDVLENGETGPRLQRFVSRRFVQDTHVVFCWKLIADGDGYFHGAKADETAKAF
ncbi:hypothetical protein PInf_018507 [Phytophthora infestans]|nr:hypothetical protein PInf_018507 [Phytophthora infestans]